MNIQIHIFIHLFIHPWAGQHSRYSDWLWAGRSGDRISVRARFSAPVQTSPGAHPASCKMGTGSFRWVKSGQGKTLTSHPLLVPWSRKGRAILPLWAVRPVQSLSACTRVHFTLPLFFHPSSHAFFSVRFKYLSYFCFTLADEDEPTENPPQWSPLQLFLMSAGLSEYVSCFVREDIDLQALMLLTEDDLKSLGLGMGPRKKLLKAINDRKAALENPGEVSDSRL